MRKILVAVGLVTAFAVGSVTPAFAVHYEPGKCDPDFPWTCDMSWTEEPVIGD